MNAVLETWLLLLAVIGGTILATLSHTWGDGLAAALVRVLSPIPVGFAAGRIVAHVALLAAEKKRREAKG